MAIDNSLYDSLQNSYNKMQEYLESTKLSPEHSQMIIKHEELAELLERLDIEAIEEQWSDIHALHSKLNEIKQFSEKIIKELHQNSDPNYTDIPTTLDTIFSKIEKIII